MNLRAKPIAAAAALACVLVITADAQRRRGGGDAALSEPYRGITSAGKIEPGLFEIRSTGVSTEPVVEAAQALLAGLSDQQRQRTTFPVDDLEWRKWDNRHFPRRQGVALTKWTSGSASWPSGCSTPA